MLSLFEKTEKQSKKNPDQSRYVGEMNVITIACDTCKHFISRNKCKAYPKGIPHEIKVGKNDHKKPYKEDNGITYQVKE